VTQILAEDTLKTIQNALKKHIDTNGILEEREKKLSREDYRLIEVDLNSKPFLARIDAGNTKASVYYVRPKI
jgi:hypothetical protein